MARVPPSLARLSGFVKQYFSGRALRLTKERQSGALGGMSGFLEPGGDVQPPQFIDGRSGVVSQ